MEVGGVTADGGTAVGAAMEGIDALASVGSETAGENLQPLGREQPGRSGLAGLTKPLLIEARTGICYRAVGPALPKLRPRP
jgi:hypothetical protein